MINFIHQKFDKHAYLIFLCALVLWIGFTPILVAFSLNHLFEAVMISLINISAIYFFIKSRFKWVSIIIAILGIGAIWLELLPSVNLIMYELERVVSLILFSMITFHLIQKIFKSKIVDEELIYVSIAGYIMLGLMAAILCKFVALVYPQAYSNISGDNTVIDFAYYSIVTMSTLGYGDIAPLIPASKSLTIFITLVGQFYMTVLVAFLIGKFLSNERN